MARNGSGTYVAPSSSWNPAINGQLASSGDWQALLNDIVAALTQSVSRDGQAPMTGNLNMGGNKITGQTAGTGSGQALIYEQLFDQGTEQDLASAATTDIGAQLTNFLRITGTTTITSFGTNYKGPRFLRFAGAVTLTNSSTLVLPGGANITTAAGDCLIVIPTATLGTADAWRVVAYQSSNVKPLGNISAGKILGRDTSSAGAVQELPIAVDTSGNLLVGKTAISDSTAGVQIYGGTVGAIGLGRSGNDAVSQIEFFRGTASSLTRVGHIQTTTTTAYVTSSDYRLKESIAPLTGALETVSMLKPCTYKWKADGSDGQGFIAHELQAVVPDCVTGEKDDTDAEGKPVYQGIDTSFLVATLTAAIQELNAKFEEYKAAHP